MIRSAFILGSLLMMGQIVNPGGGGGAPTGPCGGDLGGTMPNCTVVGSHIVAGGAALTAASSITVTTATNNTALEILDASLNSGANLQFGMGHDGSTDHEAFFSYTYDSGTGANNRLNLGFFGEVQTWSTCPAGLAILYGSCPGSGNALDVNGKTRSITYGTQTNCSSAASPAVCGSAASGSVVVAAAATTVVVNTTAVTANSQIQLTADSSLGTKLSVTCNVTPTFAFVSARTAATSFTITTTAPVTNPECLSYTIVN